jgi:hypothetical protein
LQPILWFAMRCKSKTDTTPISWSIVRVT